MPSPALFLATLSLLLAVPHTAAARPGPRGLGQMSRTGLVAGQVAPGFTLTDIHGESAVDLDTLRAEKPVVLVFGSFT